jgi:hypothetical protein
MAVKEEVALLSSFLPCDLVQTLLLAPTFMLAVVHLILCTGTQSGVPYVQLKNILGLQTQI